MSFLVGDGGFWTLLAPKPLSFDFPTGASKYNRVAVVGGPHHDT